MKQGLQNQRFYVGIDVSKLTLDVSCIPAAGTTLYQRFDNTKAGFQRLHRWLMLLEHFTYEHTLFCLEHTGLYSRQVVAFLLLHKSQIWLESSLHLKRSMGLVRGKSDKIDSLRIARYAQANHHLAKLVSPSNGTLQRLKDLHSSRDRVGKSLQSIKISIREGQRVDAQAGKELALLSKPALQGLQKSKAAIEKRMQELVAADRELNRLFELVTSIKGVGPVLATELLSYTHQFTRLTSAKQLACYCGGGAACPHIRNQHPG